MKTKDPYRPKKGEAICAILNRSSRGGRNYRDVFCFNTTVQSNVENAMLRMSFGSSDYTLCYEDRINELNDLYYKKQSKIFYCVTNVHVNHAGEKYGDMRWAMKSFTIRH